MFGFLKKAVRPEAGVRIICPSIADFTRACLKDGIPLCDVRPAGDGPAHPASDPVRAEYAVADSLGHRRLLRGNGWTQGPLRRRAMASAGNAFMRSDCYMPINTCIPIDKVRC